MKRKRLITGIAVLAVILLAGAYVAGRLLSEGLGPVRIGGGNVMISSGDGSMIEAEFKPAEELPDTPPEIAGLYSRREDNSIFVKETDGGFRISMDEEGNVSTNAGDVETEIVVTNETEVYIDTTSEQLEDLEDGDTLYQKLEPGTIEDLGYLSFMQVWGERRGERVIADVLVYMLPPTLVGR
jgi:hypothetical protein